MERMELSANSLRICLESITTIDAEDWCRVAVDVSDSGFSANFVAYLQSGDVEFWADGMAAMYRDIGIASTAALRCHEPGIAVELESNGNGQVKGKYEFRNETAGGFCPVLSGVIDMDQSYLPEWEKQCRQFVRGVRQCL